MKNKMLTIGFVVFVLLIGLYVGRNAERIVQSLTNRELASNIFSAVKYGDDYYLIANSHMEILHTDADGRLIEKLIPNTKTPAYINALTVDTTSGTLYALATSFDETGSYIEQESVIAINTKEKINGTIYTAEYIPDDAVPIAGRMKALRLLPDGNIAIANADINKLVTISLDRSFGTVMEEYTFDFMEARHSVFDVNIGDSIKEILLSDKLGRVFSSQNDENELALLYEVGEEGIFVPMNVFALEDGGVLLRDAFRMELVYISPEGEPSTLLTCEDTELEELASLFVSGSDVVISGDLIVKTYAWEDNALTPVQDIENVRFGTLVTFGNYALLIAIAVLLVVAVWHVFKNLRNMPDDNRAIVRQILLISTGLLVTVSLISYYVFQALDERTAEANYNLLSVHMQYLTSIIDVEAINALDNVSQFMTEDFDELVADLNECVTINGEQDHSKYVGILKVFDGQPIIITYQDLDTTYFTPVYPEYYDMYMSVLQDGEIVESMSSDAEGQWLYIIAPIYNDDGGIVAAAEIGFDLLPYHEANNELFKNLALQLLTVLVVIMLIFVEFSIFESKVLSKRQNGQKSIEDMQNITTGSVRVVSVLLFIAIFLTSTFMPIYSDNLYTDLWGLPREMAIVLPIVTESVFLIIAILVFGLLRFKINFKYAVLVGGLVYIAGTVLSAFADSTLFLLIARSIVGIGYGVMYIALRAYIARSDERFAGEELIAYGAGMTCGVSVGSVVGSIIADIIGFRGTFFCVAGIMLIACLVAWRIMETRYSSVTNKSVTNKKAEKREGADGNVKWYRFLFNKDILLYYFFEFLPSAICGAFLLYFLPLMADRQGYSITLVGQIFLLTALFTIYSGPILTRLTTKYFGARKSLIAAAFVYSFAIFLMAFNTDSLAIAVVTAILIGVADSFKENQETDYFLGLPVCKRVGETKAISMFGMFECSGEALGPLAYAFILSLGVSQGMMVLAASLPILILLFALGGMKRRPRKVAMQ